MAQTVATLTKADRCDRCSAAAQVRFTLNEDKNDGEGGELLFCAHHGRMHQPALIQCGTIYGELWS